MHELRREVFVDRLGWSLPLIDGVERDEYDRNDTLYVTVGEADGRITACARLLKTTSRYMLPELFPELLGGTVAPCDSLTWELSRFATSVRESGEGKVLALSKPTLDLFYTVLGVAARQGIERLLLVTSIGIERLLLRSGFDAHRIAKPCRLGNDLCVALFVDVATSVDNRAS
jgi:N-acyl-L-homoserine lactone synthetase